MKRASAPLWVLTAAVVAVVLAAVVGRRDGPPPGGFGSTNPPQGPTTREMAGGGALRGLAIELYNSDRRYRYERELADLAAKMTAPRAIWLMVPAAAVGPCQDPSASSR